MNDKIRSPILFLAIYIALMLFQTSGSSLGSMLAFITIALTIFATILNRLIVSRKFVIPTESVLLILFALVTGLSTFAHDSSMDVYFKLLAQILLCIALYTITMNKREERFLFIVFLLSTVFYAGCAIYSCIQLGDMRYVHSSILILGSPIDPNFIGIPFVAATVLSLNSILYSKNWKLRLLSAIAYIIVSVAIIFTASKGNMFGWMLTNILLILFYLRNASVSQSKKIALMVLICISAYFLFTYFSGVFAKQWDRMTAFGQGSDNGRFVLWERAVDAWRDFPLFGHGLRGMYLEYGKATHNTYLQLLSETGLVGTVLFIAFLTKLLKNAYRNGHIYFCVLVGVLLQIAFLDALDNRCMWSIIPWFALLPRLHRRKKKGYTADISQV